jgi:hypothetical protein
VPLLSQCDETKPECNRCTRVGKLCPGYRGESEIAFRFVKIRESDSSATSSSRSSPDRQFSRRKALNQAGSIFLIRAENNGALALPGFESSTDDDSSSTISQWARESSSGYLEPPIFQPLLQPWTQLALPLFINLFTTSPGRDSKQGLLTFLPKLYQKSEPDSPLRLAVSAATDANAVRKLTDLDAILQARRTHVKALVAVQKAIEDPQRATKDTTLCSLFILTLFEVSGLCRRPTGLANTCQYISGDTMIAHGSHIAGYEALLDLRSRTTDSESQEYALDLAVATQIVSLSSFTPLRLVH